MKLTTFIVCRRKTTPSAASSNFSLSSQGQATLIFNDPPESVHQQVRGASAELQLLCSARNAHVNIPNDTGTTALAARRRFVLPMHGPRRPNADFFGNAPSPENNTTNRAKPLNSTRTTRTTRSARSVSKSLTSQKMSR